MEWLSPYLSADNAHLSIPDLKKAYSRCWNQKEELAPEVQEVLPLGQNDFVCPCYGDHSYLGYVDECFHTWNNNDKGIFFSISII